MWWGGDGIGLGGERVGEGGGVVWFGGESVGRDWEGEEVRYVIGREVGVGGGEGRGIE